MCLSASKGCPFRDAAIEDERLVFLIVFVLFVFECLVLFTHSPREGFMYFLVFLSILGLFFSEEKRKSVCRTKWGEDAILGGLVTSQIMKLTQSRLHFS